MPCAARCCEHFSSRRQERWRPAGIECSRFSGASRCSGAASAAVPGAHFTPARVGGGEGFRRFACGMGAAGRSRRRLSSCWRLAAGRKVQPWCRFDWYHREVQGGRAAAPGASAVFQDPWRVCTGDRGEESPSTIGPGCRLTAGRGDPTESATEITLPRPAATVKWRGKSSPPAWQQAGQGKPHPVKGPIGGRRRARPVPG